MQDCLKNSKRFENIIKMKPGEYDVRMRTEVARDNVEL